MLAKVKTALRIVTNAYDTELTDLIFAAVADLQMAGTYIAGADTPLTITDPLIVRAIITYCRLNFGSPDDYVHLKASYDEQKGQLRETRKYTEPEDTDGQI